MNNEKRLQKLGVVITSVRICTECGRNFILTDERDADEWEHGHDCEETEEAFEARMAREDEAEAFDAALKASLSELLGKADQ